MGFANVQSQNRCIPSTHFVSGHSLSNRSAAKVSTCTCPCAQVQVDIDYSTIGLFPMALQWFW